mgnify:CR=1 FL=1
MPGGAGEILSGAFKTMGQFPIGHHAVMFLKLPFGCAQVMVNHLIAKGRDIECLTLARAVGYHIDRRVFLNANRTVVLNA